MSGVPNKMVDLNDHFFAEIERLGDESLEGDALAAEIERGKAIAEIGRAAIENGNLILRAAQFQENRLSDGELSRMLGEGS